MPPATPSARRIELIGRRTERARLRRLLPPRPSDLRLVVIQGEPGIGKTSLWLAALDIADAAGYRLLQARPAKAEARLSYGVLIDLLDGLLADDGDSILGAMPVPQRDALVAIRDGDRTGAARAWQVVGAALLTVLRAAGARGPLLIGVDDIQWADRASTRVLEYALRRLSAAPIRVVASERIGSRRESVEAEPLAGLSPDLWRLEPMLVGDLVTVLHRRLRSLSDEDALAVAATSGANPFIALEMGRAALERGGNRRSVGHAPISRRLRTLAADRVGELDDAGLEVALLASVLTHPTTALLETAAGSDVRVGQGLANAERAGVLELRGEVWAFTHPLLSAAVYDSVAAADRRAVHARMAGVTAEPEERAWHLALAARGVDAGAAAALTEAATVASARGAPDSALALLTEAIRLTSVSDSDLLAVRRLEAAQCLFALDRLQDALDLAVLATGLDVPTAIRAPALALCGFLAEELRGPLESFEYLDEALRLTEDPRQAIPIAELYADLLPFVGRAADVGEVKRENVRRGEASGDAGLLARTQADAIVHGFQWDGLSAPDALDALLRLPDGGARLDEMIALVAIWADRPDIANVHWDAIFGRASDLGDEHIRAVRLTYRADADIRFGALARAEDTLRERLPLELQGDQLRACHLLLIRARLYAIRGDARRARADARRVIELGASVPWYVARSLAAIGLLELARGDAAAAAVRYEEAAAADPSILARRHGAYFVSVDRIEALALAGRLAEARDVLGTLQDQADRWRDGWILAAVARSRAVVLGAANDLPAALDASLEAVARYDALPYPLDLGRALLTSGSLHRRLLHRREARFALARAEGAFRGLDARLWLERTAEEQARIGGRAPGADALTPSEAAVAALVAQGHTNAEVADRLVLSTRTVESHLTQVYAKLGLRSRTELASRRKDMSATS